MNTRSKKRDTTSPRNAYNGCYPIERKSAKKLKTVSLKEYLRLPNRFPANKPTVAALPISQPTEEKPHATHAAKKAVAVADREKHDDDTDSEDEDSEDEDTSTPRKPRAQFKRAAGKTANQKKAPESQSQPSPKKKAPKASGTTNFTAVSSESENASEGSPVSTEMRAAVGNRNQTLANRSLSRQRAKNASPRAQTADEVLEDTKEELRITNEELGITKDKLDNLTKKYGDQSKELKTVRATLKAAEKELDGWIEDHDKLKDINEKLEVDLAAKSGDGGGDNTVYPIDDSLVRNVKVAVGKVFRLIKFVSNDTQLIAFGDMVMNNVGLSELKFPAEGAAPDAKILARVRKNRMRFRNTYWKIWNRTLNESRTNAQVFDLLLNILTKTSKIISLYLGFMTCFSHYFRPR